MFNGPFYRQAERPPGQAAADHFEGSDVDQGFVFCIHRMKMGRRVFAPEHLNHDAEKLTDRRHTSIPVWQ